MAFNLTAQLNVALNTASLKNAASTINNQLKDVGAVRLGIPSGDADNLKNIKVQAQEASNAMEQFGRQSGLAAKRFVAFTITAGAIIQFTSSLRQAISAAIDFDREVVRLTQVSSDGAGEVAKVSGEVTKLATSYGVSSKELINVAVTLKQANLTLKETKDALEALAQAALAPSFDNLRDTTEGAIAIMNQFNISSKELGGALGAVNAVAAEFAVEAQDLIEGVRKAGGAFRSAGGDLNQFLALFTSIRQTTRESAESIGTGLRTIFARIQRNDTVEALKEIGVQLRYTAEEAKAAGDLGLTNQFIGPYEAIKRLSGALNELRSTDPRFSAIVEELGGYRQISKVIPLIQQFAVSQKALGVAQAGSVSLAQNAAQAQEAFGVKIQKVAEQFNALVRDITNTSSFRALIDILLGGASAAIKLADSLKEILPVLTAIAAVKTVQSLTSFTKGFANTAFSPVQNNQPSTLSMSPFLPNVRKKAGGGFIKMAKGGFVPGSGTGDKIPALLEPGEYVIPRKFAKAGPVTGTVSSVINQTGKKLLNDLYDPRIDGYKFVGKIERKELDDYDTYRKNAKKILNKGKEAYQVEIARANSSPEMAVLKANEAITKAFGRKRLGGRDKFLGQLGEEYFQTPKNEGNNIQYNQIAGALGEADTAKELRKNKQTSNYEKLSNRQGIDFRSGDNLIETKVTQDQVPDIEIIAKALLYQGDIMEKANSSYKNKSADLINLSNLSVYESFKNKKFAVGGLVPGTGNTDSVPLDLPIGSYVIKKSSVNSIGASNLSRLGRAKGGTIPSLVMPGEYIYTPDEAKNIGISNLDYMNTTGRKRFAAGGSNDPYKDLTPRELRLAKQIEGQLRIPTSKKERMENKNQAATIAKGMTENAQELQRQLGLRKQETNNIQKGLKNQQVLDNAAKGLIDTQNQRARILEESKAKEERERNVLSKHTANVRARATDISVLTGKKQALELKGLFGDADVVGKQIQEQTRLYNSHLSKANAAQARLTAAIQTTALAQDNLNKTSADILKLEERRKRNSEFILKSQDAQKAASKEINKLSTEYGMDKDGNITREGKVITSTYGNEYKNRLNERIAGYQKTFGEKPTGETLKAVRQGFAKEIQQGFFDQLKQYSTMRGLPFNEEFASAQSKQMTREVVSGRRKLAQNESGQFFDVGLQGRMDKTQAALKRQYENRSFLSKIFPFFGGPPVTPPSGGGGGVFSRTVKPEITPEERLARREQRLQVGGIFAGLALAEAGSLVNPGQFEGFTGNEQLFKSGKALSGGLTSAGTATTLALLIPGVGKIALLGKAAGVAASAIYGAANSYYDAAKEIESVKLNESLNKFSKELELASNSIIASTSPFTAAFDLASKNLSEKTMALAEAENTSVASNAGRAIQYATSIFGGQGFGLGLGTEQEFASQSMERFNQLRQNQLTTQAPKLQEIISKQIQANIKVDAKNFDINQFLSEQDISDQIVNIAIGLEKPIEEVAKQFRKLAADLIIQENFQKNLREGIKAEQQVVTSLSALADAANLAGNSLNNLSPDFQIISDMLSGSTSISPIKRRSNEIDSMSLNSDSFTKSLKEISSGLGGEFGPQFEKTGNILSTISTSLPNILSQINPLDTTPGSDPASKVREALTAQLANFGPESSKYINLIIGKMGDDFQKMLNEAGGDFGELAKRLESPLKDPFVRAFKEISSNYEKASDAFVDGLNKLTQAAINTSAEVEKLFRIRQEGSLLGKQNEISKLIEQRVQQNPNLLRFGDPNNLINRDLITLQKVSIDDQLKAFNNFQTELTKIKVGGQQNAGLVGGDQLNPAKIQELILANAKAQIEAQRKINEANIANNEAAGPQQELANLKFEANQLNVAMKNLANSTEELSAVQNRINSIERLIADEREKNIRRQQQVEQTGERLLTSNPEQIQRFQAGAQLTNIAERLGGNLLRFNVEQRKAIFEYLDMTGDQGQQRKSALLQATGFVAPQDNRMQRQFGGELDQLRNRLIEINQKQQQAQLFIIQNQKTLQDEFFAKLVNQNEKFFTELEKNINKLVLGQAEEKKRQAENRLKQFEGAKDQAKIFATPFGPNNQVLNQKDFNEFIKPNAANIGKYLELSKQSQGLDPYRQKILNQKPIFDRLSDVDLEQLNFLSTNIKNTRPGEQIQITKLLSTFFPEIKDIGAVVRNVSAAKAGIEATPGLTDEQKTTRIGAALESALREQLTKEIETVDEALFNLEKALGGAGSKALLYAQALQAQNISADNFLKAFNAVQALGGFIGADFVNEMNNLNMAAQAARNQINQLNGALKNVNNQAPQNPIQKPDIVQQNAQNPNILLNLGREFAALVAKPAAKATGGYIGNSSNLTNASSSFFKPKGTDTVPAILTPGEFVVNAAATSKNYGLLQAINSGKPAEFSNGGLVSYLQVGAQAQGVDENVAKKFKDAQIQMLKEQYASKYVYAFASARQRLRNRAFLNSLNLQRGNTNIQASYPYTKEVGIVSVTKQDLERGNIVLGEGQKTFDVLKEHLPKFTERQYDFLDNKTDFFSRNWRIVPRTIREIDFSTLAKMLSTFDEEKNVLKPIDFKQAFSNIIAANGYQIGGVVKPTKIQDRKNDPYALQFYRMNPFANLKTSANEAADFLNNSYIKKSEEDNYQNYSISPVEGFTKDVAPIVSLIKPLVNRVTGKDYSVSKIERTKIQQGISEAGPEVRFKVLRDQNNQVMLDDKGSPLVERMFLSELILKQKIAHLVQDFEETKQKFMQMTVEDLSRGQQTKTYNYKKLKITPNSNYGKKINEEGKSSRLNYIKWIEENDLKRSNLSISGGVALLSKIEKLKRFEETIKDKNGKDIRSPIIDNERYLYNIEDIEEQYAYQPRIFKSVLDTVRTKDNLGKIAIRDKEGNLTSKGSIVPNLLDADTSKLYEKFEKDYVDAKLKEWESLQAIAAKNEQVLGQNILYPKQKASDVFPNKERKDFKPLDVSVFKEAFRQNVGEYLIIREQQLNGRLDPKLLVDFYGADANNIQKLFPNKFRIIPNDLRKDQIKILDELELSPTGQSAFQIQDILQREMRGELKWPDPNDPFKREEYVVSELLPFIQRAKFKSDIIKAQAVQQAKNEFDKRQVGVPKPEPKKPEDIQKGRWPNLRKDAFDDAKESDDNHLQYFRLLKLSFSTEYTNDYLNSLDSFADDQTLKRQLITSNPDLLRRELQQDDKDGRLKFNVADGYAIVNEIEAYVKALKFNQINTKEDRIKWSSRLMNASLKAELLGLEPAKAAEAVKPNQNINIDQFKLKTDKTITALKNIYNKYRSLGEVLSLGDNIDAISLLNSLGQASRFSDLNFGLNDIAAVTAKQNLAERINGLISEKFLPFPKEGNGFGERGNIIEGDIQNDKPRLSYLNKVLSYRDQVSGSYRGFLPLLDSYKQKPEFTETTFAAIKKEADVLLADMIRTSTAFQNEAVQKGRTLKLFNSGGIVPSSAPNPDPSFFKPRGTDTVPAMLSPGEYVVNAKSTAKYLPLLQNLNNGGPVYRQYGGSSLRFQLLDPYLGKGVVKRSGFNASMFDVGPQGARAIRSRNPLQEFVAANSLGKFIGDVLGQNKNFTVNADKESFEAFGISGINNGSFGFSGFPQASLYSGLSMLSAINPILAGVASYATERAVFNFIKKRKEITSELTGGNKLSIDDYVNLGFKGGIGNTPAAEAISVMLSDKVGASDQISAASQSIQQLVQRGIGNVSADNTLVARSIALDQIIRQSTQSLETPMMRNGNYGGFGISGMIANAQAFHSGPGGSLAGLTQNQYGFNQPNPFFNNPFRPIGMGFGRFFADGGSVGTDKIPAMLTPGEFVVRKDAVNRIGTGFLNRINRYANGGLVQYLQQGGGSVSSSGGGYFSLNFDALNQSVDLFNNASINLSSNFNQANAAMNSLASAITGANNESSALVARMNSASATMRDSAINIQAAANSMAAAATAIPRTINLVATTSPLLVDFSINGIMQAIEKAMGGIQGKLMSAIGNIIGRSFNDEMRN